MVKSECEHLWEAVNGPDDDDGNGHSYARCKLCGDSPSESNDFSFENLAKSIRVKEVRDGRLIIGGPALALYHETGTRVGGESRTVIGLTVDQIIKLRDFYISQTGKDPAQL